MGHWAHSAVRMLRSQAEAAATPPSGPAHRNTARAAKPPNRERARATELMPPRTIAVRAAAEGKACRRPRRWFAAELVRAGNARHLPLPAAALAWSARSQQLSRGQQSREPVD